MLLLLLQLSLLLPRPIRGWIVHAPDPTAYPYGARRGGLQIHRPLRGEETATTRKQIISAPFQWGDVLSCYSAVQISSSALSATSVVNSVIFGRLDPGRQWGYIARRRHLRP